MVVNEEIINEETVSYKEIRYTFSDIPDADYEDCVDQYVADTIQGFIEGGYNQTDYEEFFRKTPDGKWTGVYVIYLEKKISDG